MRRWIAVWAAGLWASSLCAANLTVGAVSGDVQAQGSAGGFAPAQVGDTLSVGAALQTGKDGRATIVIGPRNGFSVAPESLVRLQAYGVPEAAGTVRLVLEGGRVDSTLEDWPAGSRYEVASGAGTFAARGTAFAVTYQLGPGGESIGGTAVTAGEVEYATAECSVPSVTANGGLNVVRTVGLESVMLDLTAVGNGVTVAIGNRHRISVAAGTTVRIGFAFRYLELFAALWVQEGVVTVGEQAVAPADRAVFISGTSVLPNEGAMAFLEAARTESGAYAQSQLPGLTAEQLAALRATQQSGARALVDSAVGAGVVPMYQPPFVPERPLSAPLSPSGRP
jgi:hypothetical protein